MYEKLLKGHHGKDSALGVIQGKATCISAQGTSANFHVNGKVSKGIEAKTVPLVSFHARPFSFQQRANFKVYGKLLKGQQGQDLALCVIPGL